MLVVMALALTINEFLNPKGLTTKFFTLLGLSYLATKLIIDRLYH